MYYQSPYARKPTYPGMEMASAPPPGSGGSVAPARGYNTPALWPSALSPQFTRRGGPSAGHRQRLRNQSLAAKRQEAQKLTTPFDDDIPF